MFERSFGALKDKFDARDYLYRVSAPRVTYPDIIDLNHLLPRNADGRVLGRNQGHIGSCTGHSKGLALCAEINALGMWDEQEWEWFSPTWIYNGARFMEGTLAFDNGAYPRDCLDWLLNNGMLMEHFWPYDAHKLDKTAPSSTLMRQAVKYPEFAYNRVVDGLDGILGALNDGHIVSIAAPWFTKWGGFEVDSTGVLPEATKDDPDDGGHDTCIFKADQKARMFFGINSWGEDWGGSFGVPGALGGLYALPFSVIEAYKGAGGYDASVLTFKILPDVTPEPPGTKKGCWLFR